MVVVLRTSKIRNFGIVDGWIDLRHSDIAVHESILSMVEKAHSQQRSSPLKVMEVNNKICSLEPIRIRHFTHVKVPRCCARVLPTTSGALEPCDPPYVIL